MRERISESTTDDIGGEFSFFFIFLKNRKLPITGKTRGDPNDARQRTRLDERFIKVNLKVRDNGVIFREKMEKPRESKSSLNKEKEKLGKTQDYKD